MALVDDLAAGANTDQIGSRFAPGFVVVEKGMDHRMLQEKRNGFGEVDDRYERKSMKPSKTMTLAWDAGMALSDSQAIGSLPAWNDAVAPVAGQSVIAVIALTSLVALIALLSMTALLSLVALHLLSVVMYLGDEPPLNVYLVANLAAECRGDRRDDAARGEITDQCRMPERSVGEDAERGNGGRTQDRRCPASDRRFTNTR